MTTKVADAPTDEQPKVGPPTYIILLGLLSVGVSILLLFEHRFAFHVVGYVLASFVPILTVGLFRRIDLAKRGNPFYEPVPLINRIIPVVLGLGLLAAVLHTWSVATGLAS
jgi:hypothetical protein